MTSTDAIVLGAGPAGLGAGLALARAGARVVVLEAAPRPGGLCVTLSRDGFAYDLGGHIPFVRDEARVRWLRALLDGRLHWVDRPVACVIDGRIVRGRYLDQRAPEGAADADGADESSALGYLVRRAGATTVERFMRRYLEKIDGMPLERVPAPRVERLLVGQAAPDGFWYPVGGIGRLMDAMAEAVERAGGSVLFGARAAAVHAEGGRVRAVDVDAGGRRLRIGAPALVAGLPAGATAALVRPEPPAGVVPRLRMRAVCLVYLAIDRDRLTPEPWIQVDDPAVPFARLLEARNWSPGMAPEGRTVVGMECYCDADPADPIWGLDDAGLAAACARALAGPLGLLEDPAEASALDVVRLPRAYPVVPVDEVARAMALPRWLGAIGGLTMAQGGAVIEAIEAGEAAAERVLGAAEGAPDTPLAPLGG
jgi:protoporphyrinogen oxidase